MAASTSYSTAADSNNNHCFDVFINHRGPDVKKTFASHLYRRLISYGLRVFLDYQELQEGEDLTCKIKGAIRTASVQIAIFSPTYAESKWCLDELVLMQESGAPIIPVFHNVKPGDLRWTQGEGVYARSLHNLQEKRTDDSQPRHDSITIEKWRSALSHIADISGLHLEAFNGQGLLLHLRFPIYLEYKMRDEGELLEKLVEVVLKKVKKTQLDVARYPTGLDGKVEDFETTVSLHQHSGSVQVVGITGLGGVGKTTLAKELFNKKSSNYSKSCFLFDVRENAKTSLLSLQKKLLKCLTGRDLEIDSTDRGIEMLRKNLSVLSSPVLVVLDDVDDEDQVNAILPVKNILPTNSLILITSRDKSVLSRSGVQESSIFKLSGLNTELSLELFCSHAFCYPHPLPGFECLVDKFVRACDGLPLSLKVFGGLLYGNTDKSYWVDELERLEQILPEKIQKRLEISYNALQRDEQQMFLDVACFLIGENRDTAIRIWEGSGWKGGRGLQNLLDKCLVEVGHRHRITMHDHLRDLGRELAKDSKLPCRIWRGRGRIDDLLQQSSGVSDVRGIRMLHYDDDEHTSAFSSYGMRKLQLLHIDGVPPDPRVLHSPNLIWLRWDQCYGSFLPSIPLKKLRVLHVQGWGLETLWQDEMQAPLQLRELHIDARLSNVPNSIGQLQHLEKVVVIDGNFEKLPEEICHLPSLKHLEFRDTRRLRSLPDSFGHLTNLEHIQLIGCINLERLPISFGNLNKLKYLDLTCCFNLSLSELEGLPGSEHLRSLEVLKASRCEMLKSIRWSVQLTQLRELDVSECSKLEELSGFEHLRSLEVLKASLCEELKSIRCSVQLMQLRELDVSYCSKLEKLSGFEHLRSLEVLKASPCGELKSIRCSVQLTQLRELDVSYCSKLEELSGFEHLRSLEVLKASRCGELKSIRCSVQLMQLRELDVSYCSKLEELSGFEHLRSLEVLKISWCPKLTDLRIL